MGRHTICRFGIHVIKTDDHVPAMRQVNELSGNRRWNRLATLVVTHISLRATQRLGHGVLRHPEPFTNAFEVVHTSIISGATLHVNSGAILNQ